LRIEIATALNRDIPVIPILLDGTEIPARPDHEVFASGATPH